jgi:hypothetical protein
MTAAVLLFFFFFTAVADEVAASFSNLTGQLAAADLRLVRSSMAAT